MTRPQGITTEEAAYEVSRLFAAFSTRHLSDPAAAQVIYVDRLRQIPHRLVTGAVNRVLEREVHLATIAEVFEHVRALEREQHERATAAALAADERAYREQQGVGQSTGVGGTPNGDGR